MIANAPIIIINDIPINFNMPCEHDSVMALLINKPTQEVPYLNIVASPKLSLKRGMGHPILGSFQVKSEFFIEPISNVTQRDRQIYNFILTAILNLNDLFSITHNIPTLSGGTIFFETPDFEKTKKAIHICMSDRNSN